MDYQATAQNTKGAGIDTIIGFEKLYGSNHNDVLKANNSGSYIKGAKGDDTIYSGSGGDVLYGGSGKDTFVFNTALNKNNIDTIKDFLSIDDVLKLDNDIFTELDTGTLKSSNFKANSTGKATDSNDHIVYNTKNGELSYDADGNGSANAQVFAVLDNKASLQFDDFVVV